MDRIQQIRDKIWQLEHMLDGESCSTASLRKYMNFHNMYLAGEAIEDIKFLLDRIDRMRIAGIMTHRYPFDM